MPGGVAHPELVKKTITTIGAFLFGSVLGFQVAQTVFQWLASALGAPLVAMGPTESFAATGHFGFGCGVLFATAAILGGSLRRFSLYLVIGLLVSLGAAAFYRMAYASSLTDLPAGFPRSIVLLQNLPALRIPLLGALAVVFLALIRFLTPVFQAVSTAGDHNT